MLLIKIESKLGWILYVASSVLNKVYDKKEEIDCYDILAWEIKCLWSIKYVVAVPVIDGHREQWLT